LFYKYFVPLALLPIRIVVPQRGRIFVEKRINEGNRPRDKAFQGENLLSEGKALIFIMRYLDLGILRIFIKNKLCR